MIGYHALVARLRGETREVTARDLAERLDSVPLLIDIREPDEVRTGSIPGAAHVPRGVLESAIERVPRDTEIVLFCSGGNRSVLAAASLRAMGFTDVASLAGGTSQWRMEQHAFSVPGRSNGDAAPLPLPETDAARYARNVSLPEIGVGGQQALFQASVVVVGAGGLGSPAALYLAAAGVGTITLVDPDVVDVSNLQRQILHDSATIGDPKVDSGAARLQRLNPTIEVRSHRSSVDASNVEALIEGHDVVVDATDNFPTRYLLNDASLRSGIPLVHGSAYRFEGQVSIFSPYAGPCYRCLFPDPPPPDLAPDCATTGVLGAVTGVIGSIQAAETIKLIAGIESNLSGALLHIDLLDHRWTRLEFERDPQCTACSTPESSPQLVDYDATCRPV